MKTAQDIKARIASYGKEIDSIKEWAAIVRKDMGSDISPDHVIQGGRLLQKYDRETNELNSKIQLLLWLTDPH